MKIDNFLELLREVDKNECDKLNKSSKKGIKFFPNALG